MEYEYKLLRQFTMTVGGTRFCLWLKQSQSNSPCAQGHTKRFLRIPNPPPQLSSLSVKIMQRRPGDNFHIMYSTVTSHM